MTLDQYQIEIEKKLQIIQEKEKEYDYEGHLAALNSLSEILHRALREFDDNEHLIHLNKQVTLSIIMMEIALDYELIMINN